METYPDNPWASFLEDKPETGYFSYQDQWKTPNIKRYFQNQFSNIQNQYMGQLGLQVRSGGLPTQKFMDFMQEFPWQENFQTRTPRERGAESGQFAPLTQWLIR